MEVAQENVVSVDCNAAPSTRKGPRSVRRVAMDCLARREHSFFELKQKLQNKFPDKSPEEIQHELGRLREENLQSDTRFVESFVRYRKSRGFGYLAIRDGLRSKFVAEALIDRYLFADDEDWRFILEAIISRRLTGRNDLQFGSREHLRMMRFLQGRGFSLTQIQNSLAPYLSP